VAASTSTAGITSGVGSACVLRANAIVTPRGTHAADEGAITGRAAEVADQLDAAG
jgi:hypothetical protein